MARIVYQGAEGESPETIDDLDEDELWYHADTSYWVAKVEEDDEGNDVLRRIPGRRVYYVEETRRAEERNVPSTWDY